VSRSEGEGEVRPGPPPAVGRGALPGGKPVLAMTPAHPGVLYRPIAVLAPPWQRVDGGSITGCPVRLPGTEDLGADGTAVFHQSLTGTDMRDISAVHEAGHALVYRLLDITVTRVQIADPGPLAERPRPSTSCGSTAYEQGDHRIEHLIAAHLAGGVAAEMFLERTGRGEPGNLLAAQLGAVNDHLGLLDFRGPVPLVLYYGPCEQRADPAWRSVEVDIDAMREAVRTLLVQHWPTVDDLAAHLREQIQGDLSRVASIAADPHAGETITAALPGAHAG
jgi:hypothetical protein